MGVWPEVLKDEEEHSKRSNWGVAKDGWENIPAGETRILSWIKFRMGMEEGQKHSRRITKDSESTVGRFSLHLLG